MNQTIYIKQLVIWGITQKEVVAKVLNIMAEFYKENEHFTEHSWEYHDKNLVLKNIPIKLAVILEEELNK